MTPNVIHFNFGLSSYYGGKPFSLVHYLCIRSSIEVNNPTNAYMWYEYEPDNLWWRKLKKFVTPIKIKAPTTVFKNKLYHAAHRSDVLRIQTLLNHGGIYLDCDVLCVRPFTRFLKHKALLGRQTTRGICNAVMFAEPMSEFLWLWYKRYKTFRSRGHDHYWDEHSVKIPNALAAVYPELVKVYSEDHFFNPDYANIHRIFESDTRLTEKSYSVHLWEQKTWKTLKALTVRQLLDDSSEFGRLARPYAEELRNEQKRIDYHINQGQA